MSELGSDSGRVTMSVLGAYWAQAYFEEKPSFGREIPNFGNVQVAGKATRAR
jgi:hypothetical protein